MNSNSVEDKSSCALVLMDDRSYGLIGSTIIMGELLIDAYADAFYFKVNDQEGVPIPHQWRQSLMKTPPEKSALLKGSKYFISLSRPDAVKYLNSHNVELH